LDFVIPTLEHAVLVDRVAGNGLANVPEFDDATAFKAKDVNDRTAKFARVLPDARKHSHLVASRAR
jgi:hypothetical protein